jgi:hypothetical protein
VPHNDTMNPDFERLLKPDGHLGALYNGKERIIRFVTRSGTVDYNLDQLDRKRERRQGLVQVGQE